MLNRNFKDRLLALNDAGVENLDIHLRRGFLDRLGRQFGCDCRRDESSGTWAE